MTSLVELITKSQSNDSKYPLKLYDIKYHMFMKAPDGAFITLGNKKNLSLLTVNQIDGFKAFKIGICQTVKFHILWVLQKITIYVLMMK